MKSVMSLYGAAALNSWETMKQQKTTQISASFRKDMQMSERALNKAFQMKIDLITGSKQNFRISFYMNQIASSYHVQTDCSKIHS